MIVCPKCRHELGIADAGYVCRACGARFLIHQGIPVFAPDVDADKADYDPQGLDRIARVEHRHYWFRARRQVVLWLFRGYVDRRASIIDLGAGTGDIARALQADGFRVAAGDLHLNGMRYAQSAGIDEVYQLDVLAPPFHEQFDAVGLFDVLEHLPDDLAALGRARGVLKAGGRVVATVPAYESLWSQSDRLARHRRRYSPGQLRALCERSGFRVLLLRGFFGTLLPMLALRALLFPDRGPDFHQAARASGLALLPVVNELLLAVLYLEAGLMRGVNSKVGASLALVAERV